MDSFLNEYFKKSNDEFISLFNEINEFIYNFLNLFCRFGNQYDLKYFFEDTNDINNECSNDFELMLENLLNTKGKNIATTLITKLLFEIVNANSLSEPPELGYPRCIYHMSDEQYEIWLFEEKIQLEKINNARSVEYNHNVETICRSFKIIFDVCKKLQIPIIGLLYYTNDHEHNIKIINKKLTRTISNRFGLLSYDYYEQSYKPLDDLLLSNNIITNMTPEKTL